MKIAVYGATGRIGAHIVAEATRRGHTVTALSRHQPSTTPPDGAAWQQGDVTDTAGVRRVAQDADVVVSAIAPPRGAAAPDEFGEAIIGLAEAARPTRLVVVGGAGSLLDADGGRLVDGPDFPASYRAGALAQVAVLERLRAADPDLDWTYLSPAPEISDGERTGGYRRGADHAVGSWISYADYAVALVDELDKPAHRRERFTIATR